VKPISAQVPYLAESAECVEGPKPQLPALAVCVPRADVGARGAVADPARSRGPMLLYLFSGPRGLPGGFDEAASGHGQGVMFLDLEEDLSHDLCDDMFFSTVSRDAESGVYDLGSLMSPPCSTFSMALELGGHGCPKPLRGAVAPEIYGMKDLVGDDKERVRIGTLCALRCVQIAKILMARSVPWLWEQPRMRAGHPHMFCIPEVAALLSLPGVRMSNVDQCRYGGKFQKGTVFLGTLATEELRCDHPAVWWRVPWSGEAYCSAHPKLRGKQAAVPFGSWAYHMMRSREPHGEYLTRGSACYPAKLNSMLAAAFALAASVKPPPPVPLVTGHGGVSSVPSGSVGGRAGGLPEADKVTFSTQLRGAQDGGKRAMRQLEDEDCIGGMARTARCVAALPGNLVAGGQIRVLLDRFVAARPTLVERCCEAIGSDVTGAGPSDEILDELRQALAVHLVVTDIGPVANGDCTSTIRAGLLEAWARRAGDPGAGAAAWVRSGAPAGILDDPLLAGVFPLSNDCSGEVLRPEDLNQDPEGFTNYQGIDDDPEVFAEVEEFARKGYLKRFDDAQSCTRFLGAPPVVSRFGAITKIRNGITKRRIILDVKQSRVKECTRKVHRVPLPRATDVAFDILDSLAKLGLRPDECIELLVLDFVDAFWNIPLAPEERRFFVGMLRGKFYVFLRAAQGSRNGPLAWAGVISLVMRLVQSVFWEGGLCPLRLNTYVDDPLCMIRGTGPERRTRICVLVLLWRALGLPLSFKKGCLGSGVTWIGLFLQVKSAEVDITISAARVAELLSLTLEALSLNVVSIKWLRSYAGKACSFASILVFWRPFLQFLWAAIYAEDTQGAPRNCVWTKQIQVSLLWIAAFLKAQRGDMHRRFTLEAFHGRGPVVSMSFDASPWGAGGFLVINGSVRSWFSTAFTSVDEQAVGITFGGCTSQQVAEALAILFGLRAWLTSWLGVAPRLHVRSDSVAALTMVARMKTSSPSIAVVAREMALTLSASCVRPCIVEHTPGVANKLADVLSRRFQPGAIWRLPSALAHTTECVLPPRGAGYYRSTCGP
jgi:hypothetical protein